MILTPLCRRLGGLDRTKTLEIKHASAKLQQENKKLKWKLEQVQFQLEKRMTDAKHRQHRVQMRQDDDLEEWKRKKQLLEARIQKYKSEIAHMKSKQACVQKAFT